MTASATRAHLKAQVNILREQALKIAQAGGSAPGSESGRIAQELRQRAAAINDSIVRGPEEQAEAVQRVRDYWDRNRDAISRYT